MSIAVQIMLSLIIFISVVGVWKTENNKGLRNSFFLIEIIAVAALIGCAMWL